MWKRKILKENKPDHEKKPFSKKIKTFILKSLFAK